MIAQASPAAGPLRADPSKRVNYTLGLVLGVDEFQQDQLYHAAGRRSHNRLLHGYGTAWGLAVGEVTGADPEIRVEPGVAVDPCGREICVPERMCVRVNAWLGRHQDALGLALPAGDDGVRRVPVAVVLCHRECPTDAVPVPGEPCRSQDDAMQPSRIRESFELKLMLRDDAPWESPPAAVSGLEVFRLSQPEEQAVRALGRLLARVRTTTDPALGTGEEELIAGIRALAAAADEDVLASPPAPNDDPILLPAPRADEILRRAFLLWTTEVRPALRELESPGTCGEPSGGCCVLLAEFDLRVDGTWALLPGTPPPDQSNRPYLLHTRLLQEWLLAGGGDAGRPDLDSFATLQVLGPHRVRAWVHHQDEVDLPLDGLEVFVNEEPREVADVIPAGIRNVWDVVFPDPAGSPPDAPDPHAMSDGDVVEVRFLADRVSAGSPPRTLSDELRDHTGEYLDRHGWTLRAYTVYNKLEGGDLAGEYLLPIVAKIQKFPVAPTTPGADQYLFSDGTTWRPAHLPDGREDLRGRYPDSTVVRIQGQPVSPENPSAGDFLRYRVAPGSPPQGGWVPGPLTFAPPADLAGGVDDVRVVGLRGHPLEDVAPAEGEVLVYRESSPPGHGAWTPEPAGASTGTAGGDLSGTYPNPRVDRLRGRPMSTTAPQDGQVLVYRESSPGIGMWIPLRPSGDLTGSYPSPQVDGLRGRPISLATPVDGQVLVYVESSPGTGSWTPQTPPGGSTGGPAGGDLAGTYPDPTVDRIQGVPVSTNKPNPGQYLRSDGVTWLPDHAVAAPGGPYEIIAAGRFRADGNTQPGLPIPALGTPYNGLELVVLDPAENLYELVFNDYLPDQYVYLVKGTWEAGVVTLGPRDSLTDPLLIRLFQLDLSVKIFELHVEVSRYEPQNTTIRGGGITPLGPTGRVIGDPADTGGTILTSPTGGTTRRGGTRPPIA